MENKTNPCNSQHYIYVVKLDAQCKFGRFILLNKFIKKYYKPEPGQIVKRPYGGKLCKGVIHQVGSSDEFSISEGEEEAVVHNKVVDDGSFILSKNQLDSKFEAAASDLQSPSGQVFITKADLAKNTAFARLAPDRQGKRTLRRGSSDGSGSGSSESAPLLSRRSRLAASVTRHSEPRQPVNLKGNRGGMSDDDGRGEDDSDADDDGFITTQKKKKVPKASSSNRSSTGSNSGAAMSTQETNTKTKHKKQSNAQT